MKLSINTMSLFAMMTVAVLFFALQVTAPPTPVRTSEVRYINSMPQFGKAQLKAATPATTVFDNVPQGYVTGYSTLTAQTWNFTAIFSTNATAPSDPTDLDSDSYGTIFTCQTADRTLKNWLVYDNTRSSSPRKGSVRVVNLAQYDYPINLASSDGTISFSNVSYCAETSYQDVSPGDYYFSWNVAKRNLQQANGNGSNGHIKPGKAYTIYVTPMDTTFVLDGKKSTGGKRNPLLAVKAEDTPKNDNNNNNNNNNSGEEVKEENANVPEAQRLKAKRKLNKRSKIAGNSQVKA